MDKYVDERDYKLLANDKYTFFVLRRIIDGPCTLLVSDHDSLIVCYSAAPYPVWIWTADGASDEVLERAYNIIKENNLLDKEHSFNVKYELADYIINRAKMDGMDLSVTSNMFAYDCPNPIKPVDEADGEICKCELKDKEELADLIELFHDETGIDQMDRKGCLDLAEQKINEGKTFFWTDTQGNHVATCNYKIQGDLASIGLVYTRKEHRRKHYAENLVYLVTRMAEEEGSLPMLYTDADYIASNACYEKIGYILRGKLCTIG